MDTEAHARLSYRADRIRQGMHDAVVDLEISFSVDDQGRVPVNTMIVGPFTVRENMVGVWSGWSEKMGHAKRAVYGRDEQAVGYSDYIFWQMACSEIVNKILSGLPAAATRQVFPEVAHLRGYELARELRKRVEAHERHERSLRVRLSRRLGLAA